MNTSMGRAGQTSVARGNEQAHTIVVYVNDRTGSVDRVVGLLRRRRANMQTLVLGRSIQPDVVRIMMEVDDSEVGVEQLVEQLRKLVDVTQVTILTQPQAVMRELALISVNANGAQVQEILSHVQSLGAQVVDQTDTALMLQIMGSSEDVQQLIAYLQPLGIREFARSGSIALSKNAEQ